MGSTDCNRRGDEVIPIVPESRANRKKLMISMVYWTGNSGPHMQGIIEVSPFILSDRGAYLLVTVSRTFVDSIKPGEQGKFVFVYKDALNGENGPTDSTGVFRYTGYRPSHKYQKFAEFHLVFEAISDGDGQMYVPCEACGGKRELHNEEGKLVRCARCRGLGVHLSEAEKEDGTPPELPPSTLEMKL